MPSSDSITIHPVLNLIRGFNPGSILDVGCGNGKYGFLFREILDLNYGRFHPDLWKIQIDGVEIFSEYKNPLHDYCYNTMYWQPWFDVVLKQQYDLIFMGDVLEHFKHWERALGKAKAAGKVVIVVCPNHDESLIQEPMFGNEYEDHKVMLDPSRVGGKCVWANTKAFISVCSNHKLEIDKGVII